MSTSFYFVFVDQEEKQKAYKKEKRKDRKRKATEELDSGLDPDMSAIMGFSGFGGSAKNN